ncbi:GNAT family N-acetyltransferase [Flavitalea antarctica]
MHIRPATSKDKPAIIELLRKSLGESTIPKSEALWAWKHEENPFGNSYVLLAEENEELIGLRAFMQWKWQWDDKSFSSIRAVDTATHPAHQGKGIFKKLTLDQLERCRKENISFVFNTPNSQSLPGYLKMDWKVQGKMPLKIKVLSPLRTAARLLLKNKIAVRVNNTEVEWNRVLKNLTNLQVVKISGLHTPWSASYMQWRYARNPLFPYSFITDDKNYILIYRIKEHSRFSELRLTDFYLFNKEPGIKTDISFKLKRVARETSANLLTISGRQLLAYRDYLPGLGPIPIRNAGPTITLRNLTATGEFDKLLNIDNWSYSMGDLELF